jgi:hypothetical protein
MLSPKTRKPPSPLESYQGASIATRARDLLHARNGIPFYLFAINNIYLIQGPAKSHWENIGNRKIPIVTTLVPLHKL